MDVINCFIIKQFIWYRKKYKDTTNEKFIILLYFESTQLYYSIFENLTTTQLNYQKQNFMTDPKEFTFDKNLYNIFIFNHDMKNIIVNSLKLYYNIYFIHISKNKIWTCLNNKYIQKTKKQTIFNNLFNFFYKEQEQQKEKEQKEQKEKEQQQKQKEQKQKEQQEQQQKEKEQQEQKQNENKNLNKTIKCNDNIILYEEFNTKTSITKIKTECETILKSNGSIFIDDEKIKINKNQFDNVCFNNRFNNRFNIKLKFKNNL
jgi:hypothetical protein